MLEHFWRANECLCSAVIKAAGQICVFADPIGGEFTAMVSDGVEWPDVLSRPRYIKDVVQNFGCQHKSVSASTYAAIQNKPPHNTGRRLQSGVVSSSTEGTNVSLILSDLKAPCGVFDHSWCYWATFLFCMVHTPHRRRAINKYTCLLFTHRGSEEEKHKLETTKHFRNWWRHDRVVPATSLQLIDPFSRSSPF